jgi:3-oxoadipate enol-lactonase
MFFIDVNRRRFHYILDGPAGAPVLMLSNSLGADLSMWEQQMPVLTQQFRVLRYDTRGHGLSAVTPGPYTIEGLAQDALEILDVMGLERVNFCGLSMGGMIGIWLGIHAPHRLNKLVLCNTAGRIGTRDAWDARIAEVRRGGLAAIASVVIQRWFTERFTATASDKVESARQMLLRCPAEGYVACCEAIRQTDQREQIAGIKAHTLVIAGSRDGVTTAADSRLLYEGIRGAEYVEFEASHLSNIEAPHLFTDAVVKFLAGVEA